MADIDLTFQVDRGALGLTPLDCNDRQRFEISDTMFGGPVSWQRTQVGSPYMDGQVTTDRQRQMVTDPVNINVFGRGLRGAGMTNGKLKDNFDELVQAFSQDNFVVTVGIDDAVYQYQCEASDYQLLWQGLYFIARQGQVQLQLMRQPQALAGTV